MVSGTENERGEEKEGGVDASNCGMKEDNGYDEWSSGKELEEGGDGMVLLGGGSSNNTGRPLYLKWGVGFRGQMRPWRQGSRLAATTQQHNKKALVLVVGNP